jgi:hypothetical protein
MKKEIINEINRQREMIGLPLLSEQSFDSTNEFMSFITSHPSNVLTIFENAFGGSKGAVSTLPNRNVTAFLKQIQNQLGRGLRSNLTFLSPETKQVNINIVSDGDAKVSFGGISALKGNKGNRERDLNQICRYINGYNLENFGSEQITGFNTQTDRPGQNTVIVEKTNKLGGVYVFSDKWTDIGYEKTPGEEAIASTPDIYADVAGEAIKIPMSDAFADLEVIADPGKISNAQSQLDDASAAGGIITRISISSTATATGVKPEGQSKFQTQMKSAGFPKYAQITNFEKDDDSELGDFSEMEVTSADRALAVARGKYLAKQLGFTDDQVDYTFTLVKGIPGGEGKEVTLTVTGQGEDKQELIKKGTSGRGATDASGQETFSTTDVGALGKITRIHVKLGKA